MSDYYRLVKPALNKLSELTVWDSLFVIRQYACYYIDNQMIQAPRFETIEKYGSSPIPLYFVDFLIDATVKYSNLNSIKDCSNFSADYKSLRQLKMRRKIMQILLNAYDYANKKSIETELSPWLKAYIFSQQKMQHYDIFTNRAIKYHELYGSKSISKRVQDILKMDISEYFKLVLLFFKYFSDSFLSPKEKFISYLAGKSDQERQNVMRVLGLLCIDIKELKSEIKIDFSEKMFLQQNDTQHINKPIFEYEDVLCCPVPVYILNKAIEGLQYHLNLSNDSKIKHEFASNLETYVGHQLEYHSKTPKYKYIKEFSYNKNQDKTSDWLLYDEKCIVFLDCKLKKLPIISIKELSIDRKGVEGFLTKEHLLNREKREEDLKKIDNPLEKDIIQLGVDLGKILCCYCDWKAGKLSKEIPYDKSLVVNAIILTLEDTYCGAFEMKELIDLIAIEYVKAKKNEVIDLSEIKTKVISSINFDDSIPYIERDGLYKHIVEDNLAIDDNDYLRNRYLQEEFEKFLGSWQEGA